MSKNSDLGNFMAELSEKIKIASGRNTGILWGLNESRRKLGDEKLSTFLEILPAKGEDLWDKFRVAQKESSIHEYTFVRFVEETVESKHLQH